MSESDDRLNGALAGLAVLDLTRSLAGAYCTMLLADAGASVTTVGPAGAGDSAEDSWERAWAHRTPATIAAMRAALARGKKALYAAAVSSVAEAADVIVDSGPMAAVPRPFTLDHDELRRRRPKLVTASITMWGVPPGDPLAGADASSLIAESEASLLARPRSDGAPVALGFPAGDMVTGLGAYGAIVTCLLEARRTGLGRHLDLSMVRTLLATNAINVTGAQIPAPPGHGTAGYGVFRSRDGFVILGVNTDTLWARLCGRMERPDLAADPRYAQYGERDTRVAEVNAIVTDWTLRHSSDELVEIIGPSGVPVGKILDAASARSSPHLRRLGYFLAVEDGHGATIEVPANPMGFTPASGVAPTAR